MTTKCVPKIYFDPADEPVEGSAILMTSDLDRRRKWRADTVEGCLRLFLKSWDEDAEDWIFRRSEDDLGSFSLWEIANPVRKGKSISGTPGRLLAQYHMVSSFRRTITIDPELGQRYGVVEVYMLSDEVAGNFSYLDRTGKIRPLYLRVAGEAVEPGSDKSFLREEVEAAIPESLEPVYPYRR